MDTHNGDVQLALAGGGAGDVETHNGEVALLVPRSSDVRVVVETHNGSIDGDGAAEIVQQFDSLKLSMKAGKAEAIEYDSAAENDCLVVPEGQVNAVGEFLPLGFDVALGRPPKLVADD